MYPLHRVHILHVCTVLFIHVAMEWYRISIHRILYSVLFDVLDLVCVIPWPVAAAGGRSSRAARLALLTLDVDRRGVGKRPGRIPLNTS